MYVHEQKPDMNETKIFTIVNGKRQEASKRVKSSWWQHPTAAIEIGGEQLHIGKASGEGMNCLIDTLRQIIAGGLNCNVGVVRRHLERTDKDIRPRDFLDFAKHWRATVALLARHNDDGKAFVADEFTLKCVDLSMHSKIS